MIGLMGRRARASITLLLLGLFGSGSAQAQSTADSTGDSGWFDGPQGDADQGPTDSESFTAPPAAPSAAPSEPSRPAPAPEPDDADPRALTEFKPTLDPYGTWVEDPRYGTVWVPYATVVGSDFQPYVSAGHWALSAEGDWVWVSDYPFGWVTFHYGRWVWVSGSGWAWIPGYRYAPAWVAWRVPTGEYAYVGWAPYGPEFIWVDGYPVSVYYAPPYYWAFCPSGYVFSAHVHYYMVRDRPLLVRLGHHSRYYTPAAPHPRPRTAAQSRPRTPAAPSPTEARIPASAVPRERVSATPAPRATPSSSRERFSYERSSAARAAALPQPAARTSGRARPSPAPVRATAPVQPARAPAPPEPSAERVPVVPRQGAVEPASQTRVRRTPALGPAPTRRDAAPVPLKRRKKR